MRELRQNASRYLAQVAERREPIEITDHGRPVARLVPVISDDWANLIAAAEVTPADPRHRTPDRHRVRQRHPPAPP